MLPHCADRFIDGVEVLKDSTELHIASFRPVKHLSDGELAELRA